ncbi:MAG: MFS transporter, partial [Deltaproteobacteria bacterium]|nr:MFS transporter [Deltaproteobacteria bacterium]
MSETPLPSVWRRAGFRAYLGSTAFTGVAFSMQQLLVSWLLVGVLLLPGDQVGMAQALMGLPGILLMLWGGASADRMDPRTLLLRTYAIAPVIPLALVAVDRSGGLSLWTVAAWGLGMSTLTAFSSPAHAAILNRVSGTSIQQGVTASTVIAFTVQILGLALAGQLERVGLATVLLVQAACLALGVLALRRIHAQPPAAAAKAQPAWRGVVAGLRATARNRVVLAVVTLNFVSSVFNAGAFVTALPFIIKRVYGGDAALLAGTMIVFFAGATVSNLILFRFMPLAHPGRLFLLMQLTRAAIVGVIWMRPDWWLLVAAMIAWGLNMGITTTTARAVVQESASPEFRGRILSVYNVGLLGSAPLGALVLGGVIEAFGTLNA